MGNKRRRSASESEEDESFFEPKASPNDEEVDGEEEEPTDNGISPIIMAKYVKEFMAYIETNGKKNTSVKSLPKLIEDFLPTAALSEQVDKDSFTKSLRKFLHASLKQSNLSISNGLKCVEEYLDRPEIIATFPDFPKRPPTLFVYYGKKINIKSTLGEFAKDVKVKMEHDSKGRTECEREVAELEGKYLEELNEFARNHPELSEKHSAFLQGKITSLTKKLHSTPRARTPGPTPKKPKKKAPTAFELYCRIEAVKYDALTPEKRDKKLRKKFDKLDDSQREIYEKIASMPPA